jgi:predicted site-specific integrase-resolvase
MADKWVTRAVACQVKGISERTLRRWINEGKIQSKHEGNRLSVLVDIADTEAVNIGQGADIQSDTNLIEQVRRENELLREQIKEKDQQINQQQAIIMQLSRNQQLMLESSEQKAKRFWWSRLFKRHPDGSS